MAEQKGNAWDTSSATRIVVSLDSDADADLRQKLSEVDDKQGYIKSLIRADVEKETRRYSGMTVKQREAYNRFRLLSTQESVESPGEDK